MCAPEHGPLLYLGRCHAPSGDDRPLQITEIDGLHDIVERASLEEFPSLVLLMIDGLDAVVSDSRLMPEPRHHLVEDTGHFGIVVNDEDADDVVGHG